MNKEQSCCSGSGCCRPPEESKKIVIEFLYLDLSVCGRCQGTEKNLDAAVNAVTGVLKAAGFDVAINKVNITSAELAEQYQFLSSPTIRINGRDIALDVKESDCRDCGDLCGDSVDCRVFTYEGAEYNEPPQAMIVNAILKEVYGASMPATPAKGAYILPENLRTFFAGSESKKESK